MNRKCHNHTPQVKIPQREEETQNNIGKISAQFVNQASDACKALLYYEKAPFMPLKGTIGKKSAQFVNQASDVCKA